MDFGESGIFRGSSDSEGDGEAEGENVTPLIHLAASRGDTRQLVHVVQEDPAMLEQLSSDGLTPLGQAVLSQQMAAVKRLVKMGANINAQDNIGRTCLSIAAYQGWLEGVVYLLRNGARQNICDKTGRHPIHAATYDKDVRTLLTLLQTLSLAEINQQDHEEMTALHWAAFHNRPEHLKCLMERGGNVLASDVDGKLPLHWAAQNGCLDCCGLLLQHAEAEGEGAAGRMLAAEDHTGKTPLHFAAAAGHTDILRLLAAHPACRCDVVDPDGRTPLHWAAAMGHAQCVHVLLEMGVKGDTVDADGGTPLIYATQSGHTDCVKLLEQSLNTPRAKAESKKAQTTHSSRRDKNPIGFLKGLFQSSRKDGDVAMSPHNHSQVSDPASFDKREANTNAAATDFKQGTFSPGCDSRGDEQSNERFSLPPISQRGSRLDNSDTGSTYSSLPSRGRLLSSEESGQISQREQELHSKRVESRGSKGYPATTTPNTVLPPLLHGLNERELGSPATHDIQELGPLRGVKVQQPRQLSARMADRMRDGTVFRKSATEFWSSQSRERSTTPRPLTEPQQQQHQKQQQQQQRHTLTGKKRPRRKKSRRGQDCPVSDRSDRAAVAISPSRPEKHRNSLTAQGDPNTTPLDHCIHPSSSSQTPKPRQHPHKLKSARTSASQFAGSLRVPGARDDSTGGNGSHVFVPAELRGVGTAVGGAGQEKERTLFVAASSVSFHTRAPSFSSREKRRLTNRKSDLRLLDL